MASRSFSFAFALPSGASAAATFHAPTQQRLMPSHRVDGLCITCVAPSSSDSVKYASCIFSGLATVSRPLPSVAAAVAKNRSFAFGSGTSSRRSFADFIAKRGGLPGRGGGCAGRRAGAARRGVAANAPGLEDREGPSWLQSLHLREAFSSIFHDTSVPRRSSSSGGLALLPFEIFF